MKIKIALIFASLPISQASGSKGIMFTGTPVVNVEVVQSHSNNDYIIGEEGTCHDYF